MTEPSDLTARAYTTAVSGATPSDGGECSSKSARGSCEKLWAYAGMCHPDWAGRRERGHVRMALS
jgi:hypothetical protein